MRPPDSWATARFTLALTGATAVIFIVLEALGLSERAADWGAFVPAHLSGTGGEATAPFWITPLTSAFLHANWLHLAFNLVIFAFCGRQTEGVLGSEAIVVLYLLGAYAAALGQYVADPLSVTPMIGASGAISATIGAYAILFGRNKVKVKSARLAVLLNALWLMVTWIALNLVVSYTFADLSDRKILIAAGAHIGGFVVGVLLANPLLLFRYRKA